jgi:signal peptidase II
MIVRDLKVHITFWSLTVAGLSLDLWTKKAIFNFLDTQPDYTFPIIKGFLSLVKATNDGAAFGIAQGRRNILTVVSIIAFFVIVGIYLFSAKKRLLFYVALSFFTAGICGNLYDRIFNYGMVRDFIDVVYWPGRHWPAFNVADSLLCIAVALILWCSFTEKPSETPAPQHK